MIALGLVVSCEGCFGQVPRWPKGADCKSVAIGFQGSNPCLPTTSGLATWESKACVIKYEVGIVRCRVWKENGRA